MIRVLTGFTVADDDRSVYCGSGGASWGFICNDTACTGKSYIGWDDALTVGGAAVFHLQWHANGMPECKHCGGTLANPRARTCPRGECSVRDGGR